MNHSLLTKALYVCMALTVVVLVLVVGHTLGDLFGSLDVPSTHTEGPR